LIFTGCIEEKSLAPLSTPLPTTTPIPTPTDISLGGNRWTLTSFIVGDDVRSPISGTTITVSFKGGKISGTAGCNQYFGSYTIVNEIIIEDLTANEIGCLEPVGILQQETQYLDILRDITTYTIEENQLTLSAEDGQALVYQAEL